MTIIAPTGSSSPLKGVGEARHAAEKESERSEHRVKVALRTRPLLPQEKIQKAKECVYPEASKSLVTFGRDRGFHFDHVFDQNSRQEDVFLECTSSLVDAVFEGYNACVFAYGQTSSGKTFTMGSCSHLIAEEDVGLIPRVINCIFERIEAIRESAAVSDAEAEGSDADAVKFKVKCQFLEIHNEEVKDLLNPSTSKNSIAIRENSCGQIVVSGTKEETVETREDLMRLLEIGSASRTTGDTRMNAHSSRSHAIFTIILDQDATSLVDNKEEGGAKRKISAKFHMVDLAGSERQKKTGATGKRFKESVTINRGLLALGNVINALSSKQSQKHVPYRESKLTRMLQDSIGGNSRTIMIACVSTSDGNMEETLNTLKYASRARNIKNTTFVNYRKDPKEDELPDSDSTFVEVDQNDSMAANFEDSSGYGDKVLALAEKLREAETRNLTLQGLLNDKIAIESCVQQLVHKFSSAGMVSEEAAKVFKEAFLSPLSVDSALGGGDNLLRNSRKSANRPPLFRPSSAVHQTRDKKGVGSYYRPNSATTTASTPAPVRNTDVQEDIHEEGGFYHRHAYPFAGESANEIDLQQQQGGGVHDDFSAENEDEVLFDEEDLAVPQNVLEKGGTSTSEDDDKSAGSAANSNDEQELELKLSKRKLEDELKQLSSHISHKEDLIEQLTRNQEEAEAASQAYESRAQELEVQVREKEREVESLKAEVSNLDESIAQSVEEKHELRLEYDEKLHHVVQQLSSLKSKLKEGDATRLERVRQQSDKKISHLESDLDTMKMKQDSLRKKLGSTQRKYEQEVERIRKEADDSNRRVQQLEIENKRKTTLLKKKAEEAASAQRKLKELNQNSANTDLQTSSPLTKGIGSKGQSKGGSNRSLAAVGKQVGVDPLHSSSMKSRAVFDAQIEKMVQKNEVKEQLQSQKRRKIGLMAERENLLQELSPYQQKKDKQREITNLKIREFMYAIEELDAEIDKMQGEASAGNEIAAKEVIELQNFRSDAYTRRCDLQNMLSTGHVLSDKEEEDVSELEDRLDGIVTELDYVIQQINESKVQLEEAEASGRKMKRLMTNLSQKETQSLLAMYLNNVVDMHSKERRDEKRLCELEIVNSRFKNQIDHLSSSIKARDFEYDLRTTQLEKEHANKMQDVFSHMGLLSSINASSAKELQQVGSSNTNKAKKKNSSQEEANAPNNAQQQQQPGVKAEDKEVYELVKLQHEQISVLDKEKVQLRSANAELSTKMKQLESEVAVNQNRYEQNILSVSMKFEETNSLNQSLMEEVSNYKKHLRSLGSAVRISRSSLRPLSAKQIQQKQMRASQSEGLAGLGGGP